MVVKTELKGRACMGVSVGDNDIRRYFPQRIKSIDLELDHLLIRCGLGPGFWEGHGEISDPRLCAWLEAKNFNCAPGEAPVALDLIPSGKDVFRLKVFKRSNNQVEKSPEPALVA